MIFIQLVFLIGTLGIFQGGADSFDTERIVVGEQSMSVWVAETVRERRGGLSGIEQAVLAEAGIDGMLFLFDNSRLRRFWMVNMQFPLDIVWVEDGVVVSIETDVPHPAAVEGEIRYMYSDPYTADTVLELPAGKVEEMGISIGDSLTKVKDSDTILPF